MKIRKARDAAKKAQKLLQNVSNRKKSKEVEKDGLIITKAIYGNLRAARGTDEHIEVDDDVASLIFDVTLPLNFLVTNSRLEVCYELFVIVCNFNLYRSERVVHTGPPGCRYADRPLPCGTVKNRQSTVDFGRQWPIEGEKGKKKKRKRRKEKRGEEENLAPSSPAHRRRPRPWVVVDDYDLLRIPDETHRI
ncbi:hypothetical protein GW17_00031789 [Ensete ventricosum]|nr:hypothetical protein GW17_00031789 [Ensete ventricosum]